MQYFSHSHTVCAQRPLTFWCRPVAFVEHFPDEIHNKWRKTSKKKISLFSKCVCVCEAWLASTDFNGQWTHSEEKREKKMLSRLLCLRIQYGVMHDLNNQHTHTHILMHGEFVKIFVRVSKQYDILCRPLHTRSTVRRAMCHDVCGCDFCTLLPLPSRLRQRRRCRIFCLMPPKLNNNYNKHIKI